MATCGHLDTIKLELQPSADGCEDCLRMGGRWMHFRMCQKSAHFGGCDQSPHRNGAVQRPVYTAEAAEPGRILVAARAELRSVFAAEPDLADVILRSFVARRRVLRDGEGSRSIQLLGSRFSARTTALRGFLVRAAIPHQWLDLEDVQEPDVLLAHFGVGPEDAPVVILPTAAP